VARPSYRTTDSFKKFYVSPRFRHAGAPTANVAILFLLSLLFRNGANHHKHFDWYDRQRRRLE
jgi:hypothetical protein